MTLRSEAAGLPTEPGGAPGTATGKPSRGAKMADETKTAVMIEVPRSCVPAGH